MLLYDTIHRPQTKVTILQIFTINDKTKGKIDKVSYQFSGSFRILNFTDQDNCIVQRYSKLLSPEATFIVEDAYILLSKLFPCKSIDGTCAPYLNSSRYLSINPLRKILDISQDYDRFIHQPILLFHLNLNIIVNIQRSLNTQTIYQYRFFIIIQIHHILHRLKPLIIYYCDILYPFRIAYSYSVVRNAFLRPICARQYYSKSLVFGISSTSYRTFY